MGAAAICWFRSTAGSHGPSRMQELQTAIPAYSNARIMQETDRCAAAHRARAPVEELDGDRARPSRTVRVCHAFVEHTAYTSILARSQEAHLRKACNNSGQTESNTAAHCCLAMDHGHDGHQQAHGESECSAKLAIQLLPLRNGYVSPELGPDEDCPAFCSAELAGDYEMALTHKSDINSTLNKFPALRSLALRAAGTVGRGGVSGRAWKACKLTSGPCQWVHIYSSMAINICQLLTRIHDCANPQTSRVCMQAPGFHDTEALAGHQSPAHSTAWGPGYSPCALEHCHMCTSPG